MAASEIQVGQVYRDTYYDGLGTGREGRTIRIEAIEGDKAHAQTLTTCLGDALSRPRKTKVSFKTLRNGYVLVPSPGAA